MAPRSARRFLFIAIALLVSSCASEKTRVPSSDLRDPPEINQDGNRKLSRRQVDDDLAEAVYALKNAYSGFYFLPNGQFPELLRELGEISGPLAVQDLCDRIGTVFLKISDNRLKAVFSDRFCGPLPERLDSTVGKNHFSWGHGPWDVRLETVRRRKILKISVLTFPPSAAPQWRGFLDQVKKNLPRAQMVVLDLRDNFGGDDKMGRSLAQVLAGQNLESPFVSPQWVNTNPDSVQLLINWFESEIRRARLKGWPADLFMKGKARLEAAHDAALKGQLTQSNWSEVVWGTKPEPSEPQRKFDPKLAPKKPIYILMNSNTASSAENTIHFLEADPHVKKVGENTKGQIHFENTGTVILRNSGIELQIATAFIRFKDGRFLEKIGIRPDIAVPPGRDAMDVAIEDFLNKGSN